MKNVFRSAIESQVTEEPGMVSAEYAVGTVATTSLAGLLVWLFQQDWVRDGLISIFKMMFSFG